MSSVVFAKNLKKVDKNKKIETIEVCADVNYLIFLCFLLDVASGANSPKLVECVRRMCDLYDRPCLIIEKDRVKPGETDKKL